MEEPRMFGWQVQFMKCVFWPRIALFVDIFMLTPYSLNNLNKLKLLYPTEHGNNYITHISWDCKHCNNPLMKKNFQKYTSLY